MQKKLFQKKLIKLNNLNLKNIAENLLDTFIEAGSVAKKISKDGVKITIKDDNSPVTNGDIAVDKMLRQKISTLTEDIPIISEETVDLKVKNVNKNFWLIDPIDGTLNFLNGIPHFAISIAYEEKKEIICGLIFDPIKDEIFFAEKGSGSFFNNSRIRVSKKNKLIDSILIT